MPIRTNSRKIMAMRERLRLEIAKRVTERGLTLKAAAHSFETSVVSVQRIMNDSDFCLSLEMLINIADKAGLDVDIIIWPDHPGRKETRND